MDANIVEPMIGGLIAPTKETLWSGIDAISAVGQGMRSRAS